MGRIKSWVERHAIAASLGALLVGLALGAGGMASGNAGLEEKLTAERRAHEESKDELKDLGRQLSDTEAELSDTEGELTDARAESASLSEDLENAEAKLTALRSRRPLPKLVGKTQSHAESLAEEFGWELEVARTGSERKEGTVLEQTPSAGSQMKYGSSIKITVAKPLPPGWKDIRTFSGQGKQVTGTFRIPDGRVRILYGFSGNTNASITMYQKPREYIELFLNEIGDRSGTTRVYYSGSGYYFEVCCGSWTVRVQEWR